MVYIYIYSVKYCDPIQQATILELLISNHKPTLNISIAPLQGQRKRCSWCGHGHTTFSTNVPILYHKPIMHDKAGFLHASERAMLAPHLRMACLRGLTR